MYPQVKTITNILTAFPHHRLIPALNQVYSSSSRVRSTPSISAGVLCATLVSSRSRTLPLTDRLSRRLSSAIELLGTSSTKTALALMPYAAVSRKSWPATFASRFREVVSLALNGNYSGNRWFEEENDLMYLTAVVNRNERFAGDIEKHGHT
jgi:hypothetical protein